MFEFIKNKFSRNKNIETLATDIGIYGNSSPIWPNKDYDNYSKETYLKNLVSFRCIDMIAKSTASVPWELYRKVGDSRQTVENNFLNNLLKRPNPKQSWLSMFYEAMAYLLLSGNQFLLRVAPTNGETKEIYNLRPSNVKILKNDAGEVTGYTYGYGMNEKTYNVDMISGYSPVLHTKFFNPLNDSWGTAIVEPAAREIDTNNAAIDWHKGLLDNQARPGLMLFYERQLSSEQRKLLKQDLREQREGGKNAGKTMLLEGAKDARPYGFTPTEMDFIEGNRDKTRAIASAFGVPAQLLGIKGDQTFANFAEARLFFWEDTVFWYLNLMKEQLNYWFFPDEDLFMDYNIDNVPALAPKRDALWKRATEATFISENEKREMVGYDAREEGDVILVSANLIPLSMATSTDTGNQKSKEIDDNEEAIIKELIENGYTETEAIEMLYVEPDEEKPYANEHACRLLDPKQFTNYRRRNNAAQVNGKRIDFIYGEKNGKWKIQAIRYPKNIWSASEARSHCNTHDPIEFEEASGGNE